MKHYNRTTKRWEEAMTQQEAHIDAGKFGKRKECIGGREHDYKLVLPSYIAHDNLTPELILEYYASEERRREADRLEDELMSHLGFLYRHSSPHVHKHYQCIRCKKRNYDLKV